MVEHQFLVSFFLLRWYKEGRKVGRFLGNMHHFSGQEHGGCRAISTILFGDRSRVER